MAVRSESCTRPLVCNYSVTATELIIQFLLENEQEDNPNFKESGWQWAIRVGFKVYYGEESLDAIINAFENGAFEPDYPPSEPWRFFPNRRKILRQFGAEIVKRPHPIKQWHLRDDFTQLPPPWNDSGFPPPPPQQTKVTSNDVLDVYRRAKQYPEGSSEREKLMRQAREMSARLESLLSRLPIH